MSPSPAAVAHQRRQARAADAAARAAGRAWARVDRENLRESWRAELAAVVAAVAAAQLVTAQSTEPYLMRLLGREDAPPAGDRLDPRSMVGVTVDGRPLLAALFSPMLAVLGALSRGVPLVTAFATGRALLDLTVRTTVADTARAADTVGMVTRPAVTSYIRVVEGSACERCVVLAGREYGVSTGFARHPRCHCGMEPVTREHRPTAQSPRALFDRLSPEQQAKRFGAANALAIRQGADIASVVNARRGMSEAGSTLEATTRRGSFFRREFRRLQQQGVIPANASTRGVRLPTARLTPTEIMRQSATREQAVDLLRQNGYLS